MNAPRRKFLKAGVLAIAAGNPLGWLNAANMPVPPGGRFSPGSDSESFYDPARFTPLLGATFQVQLHGNQLTYLSLSEVEDLYRPIPRMTGPVFALRFKAFPQNVFPQGSYTFSHPRVGQFELFVAPVERPGRFITYEAVINRCLPTSEIT